MGITAKGSFIASVIFFILMFLLVWIVRPIAMYEYYDKDGKKLSSSKSIGYAFSGKSYTKNKNGDLIEIDNKLIWTLFGVNIFAGLLAGAAWFFSRM